LFGKFELFLSTGADNAVYIRYKSHPSIYAALKTKDWPIYIYIYVLKEHLSRD